MLEDTPVTGVRLYNHYDDGKCNNVGGLDCAPLWWCCRMPTTGHALAIVDEHWSYAGAQRRLRHGAVQVAWPEESRRCSASSASARWASTRFAAC